MTVGECRDPVSFLAGRDGVSVGDKGRETVLVTLRMASGQSCQPAAVVTGQRVGTAL